MLLIDMLEFTYPLHHYSQIQIFVV